MRTAEERRVISKRGFDPSEPRDFHGRWTSGGSMARKIKRKIENAQQDEKAKQAFKDALANDAVGQLKDNPAFQAAKNRREKSRVNAKWQKVQDAAQKALDNAERQLSSGSYSDRQHFPSGIGDVNIFTFEDGSKAVLKTTNDDTEVAAEIIGSRLAQRMGLKAPTVQRTVMAQFPDEVKRANADANTRGKHGMMMSFVDGQTAWDFFNRPMGAIALRDAQRSDEGKKIGLLDTLIQNMDRHDGNWMVDREGNLVPIDHGGSMWQQEHHPYDPEARMMSMRERIQHYAMNPPAFRSWYAPASAFATHARLYTEENGVITGWLENDFTKADIQKIRDEIMSLKGEFDKLPKSAEDNVRSLLTGDESFGALSAVLDRLDQLEAHATGEKDLLP